MLADRPESSSFSPFSPWIRTWTVGAQNVRGLPLRNWKARSESNELAWVRFVYLCHFSVPLRIGKITFFEESGTSFSGGWALWRGLSWSNPQFGHVLIVPILFYGGFFCFISLWKYGILSTVICLPDLDPIWAFVSLMSFAWRSMLKYR